MVPHIFVLLLAIVLNDGRVDTAARPFATSDECVAAATMVIQHAKQTPLAGVVGVTAGCIDIALPIKLENKPADQDSGDVVQPKGAI